MVPRSISNIQFRHYLAYDEPIGYHTFATPLGDILLVATPRTLCQLRFREDKSKLAPPLHLTHLFQKQLIKAPDWIYNWWQRLLQPSPLTCTVLSAGTPFQEAVWQALCTIPRGTTCSYQALALKLGKNKAARTIGQAVGSNELACVIPCHRVVRSDGTLGGYRWGLWRKQRLLMDEMN